MNNKYIKFALGDVFDIKSPKKRFNANTVKFGGKHPYVVRSSANNGIRGYITEDEKYLSPAKSLSFGQDTATIFYQPVKYFTGDKIKVMVLRNRELNDRLAQYFLAAISKAFQNFSWGQSSFNEDIIKLTKISLPVIESSDPNHEYTPDDIDWQYMQERIKELEQERIKELEQERIKELDRYLKAAELDDCALTAEDKNVLSSQSYAPDNANILTPIRKIKTKKFTLGELFSASTGDVDLQKKDLNGNGQFLINSGVDNQGIKGKTDKTAKIFPANTITIDFWGNAYYRDFEYKMATHNHVFSLSGDVIKNKYVGIYIVGLLSEFPKLFSYDNMATWNKLKELEIELPVTDYGDKDYDYMERYIRAMEKVVIKEVVEFKDKWIETTKKVVARE